MPAMVGYLNHWATAAHGTFLKKITSIINGHAESRLFREHDGWSRLNPPIGVVWKFEEGGCSRYKSRSLAKLRGSAPAAFVVRFQETPPLLTIEILDGQ
ncbi:hypothetical protein TNCV_2949881 [Trichonephila clavipes]|nr:hypothetical protein TNCV_2949881 [Trichonephila clavipes]